MNAGLELCLLDWNSILILEVGQQHNRKIQSKTHRDFEETTGANSDSHGIDSLPLIILSALFKLILRQVLQEGLGGL